MNGLETAFFYLAIALAIYLPFNFLMFAFRERYALILIKRQKQGMDKLLRNLPVLIGSFRALIWLSLLCLVVVPVALFYYLEIGISITFTSFALMFANTLVIYHLENWLYQFLTKLES